MKRPVVIVNVVLAVLVLSVGFGAYLVVGNPGTAGATIRRSTTVGTGSVTATVTGSGNLASGSDTTVSATRCTGTLLSVSMSLGQRVHSGEVLARIDPTTANQDLAGARASLTQLQASNAASVSSARQSAANAQASAALDLSQAQDSVNRAQQAAEADQNSLQTARTNLIAARAAVHPSAQAITSAQSSYESAASKLSQDQASLVQSQQQQASTQLKDSQQVSSAQIALQQAQSGVGNNSAGTTLTTAEQNVANDESALASCTIIAPASGTITALNAQVGASAGSSTAASTSGNGASTSSTSSAGTASSSSGAASSASASAGLATISDLSRVQVTAAIAEADIASIKLGQKASLTFPALTDASDPSGLGVEGTVTAIAPTSTVTSGVVTYSVTIGVAAPPASLRLGQTTNVTITTASKTDVLRVVSTAVTALGGAKTVDRVKGASSGTVVVTTGVTGGGYTEITSGLQAGDQLLLPNVGTSSTTSGSFGGRSGVGGVAGAVGGTR